MDAKAKAQENTPETLKTQVEELRDQGKKKDRELFNQKLRIQQLEEKIRLFQGKRFGSSSERNSGQSELQLFNEAEVIVDETPEALAADQETEVSSYTRKKTTRVLPKDLPRVKVVHDLDDNEKQCECGQTLQPIDEEVLEQLAVIPLQYYVIRHIKKKYACSCKACIKTAKMPKQALPKSQISANLLAHVMVSKFLDGLPLYRQEKIAARNGFELPRSKLARNVIKGSELFQPIFNLLEDTFFSYDIAAADETHIQVLKEDNRSAESKSQLWMRRGGPPDKPMALVDYSPSRSGATAYGFLENFKGYLVADAYPGYNQAIEKNELKWVACNDHARRKYSEVLKSLGKRHKHYGTVAETAVSFYKRLYKIEKEMRDKSDEERYQARKTQSLPIWKAFKEWVEKTKAEGVLHEGTRNAMQYQLNHWEALTRYCDDGRLPISNIKTEHIAKTIAVARKNFLFADTPAGAKASAMIYSILETAKANLHHPIHYLTVLLTELPNVDSVEGFEALLPWNLSPEKAKVKYNSYPSF